MLWRVWLINFHVHEREILLVLKMHAKEVAIDVSYKTVPICY